MAAQDTAELHGTREFHFRPAPRCVACSYRREGQCSCVHEACHEREWRLTLATGLQAVLCAPPMLCVASHLGPQLRTCQPGSGTQSESCTWCVGWYGLRRLKHAASCKPLGHTELHFFPLARVLHAPPCSASPMPQAASPCRTSDLPSTLAASTRALTALHSLTRLWRTALTAPGACGGTSQAGLRSKRACTAGGRTSRSSAARTQPGSSPHLGPRCGMHMRASRHGRSPQHGSCQLLAYTL